MFRHLGKFRTFRHNLKIASLLSFVAGLVNVSGFLAAKRLTTNITGHFAFLVDEIFKLRYHTGLVYFLYITCFFLGSYTSSLLVEWLTLRHSKFSYTIPVILESSILFLIGICSVQMTETHADLIAAILLFAMGLQNSMVTSISNATVRTTHLTGLFTDLGIDLSRLPFRKYRARRQKLLSSIKLRLTIIACFFCGGLSGGILYTYIHMKTMCVASALLLVGVLYDVIRYRIILTTRQRKGATHRL